MLRPIVTLAILAALGCAAHPRPALEPAPSGTGEDGSPHRTRFVEVGGLRLHTLDWGGSGETVVLLAGLGNSAHVFDELAPRLTDRFHVVALTRRGAGESSRPSGGYDTGTLVEDLRGALDALGLDRVHLVGHSLAGDELTGFASAHPERVGRLVYLDAAYDRAALRKLLALSLLGNPRPPAPPRPGRAARASDEAFGQHVETVYGVRWPEGEITTARVHPAAGTFKAMLGAAHPRYRGVRAPALALYAVQPDLDLAFPWLKHQPRGAATLQWAAFGALNAPVPARLGAWNWWKGRYLPFAEEQRRQAGAELADAEVQILEGSHYLFLDRPDEVAARIAAFLEG